MSWQEQWSESSRRIVIRPRHPARTLALLFVLAIVCGGMALQLPLCSRSGLPVDASTAYFTATSAVCVTGLAVVDTAATYSFFGQAVLLLLIQVGALGYMLASTLLVVFLRREPNFHDRILLRDTLGQLSLRDTFRLVRHAVLFTLVVEALGAALLASRFLLLLEVQAGDAIWLGLFHSVSAFGNAGFDLFGPYGSTSLSRFRGDWIINFTVAALITTGGLGFLVCHELLQFRIGKLLSVHSRIVLATTLALMVAGTVAILLTEWTNEGTLAPLPWPEKLLAAFFQSVTTRTAGFATLDLGSMRSVTLVILGLLMFVGGSPGSTAGGVKTTTFATMLLAVRASLSGRSDVEVFHRRLSPELIYRALVLAVLFLAVFAIGTFVLAFSEPVTLQVAGFRTNLFMRIQFETLSALATVGLSTGITPAITPLGRVVLMGLMFVGRLGPITVAAAIAAPKPPPQRRLPAEEVSLG